MNSPLLLYPLKPDYVPELCRSCWPQVDPLDSRRLLHNVWQRQERGHAWGLVAWHGEEIAGFGQLSRWGVRSEISDLIVPAARRGQGIGTTLIQRLVAIACEQNFQSIEIGVAESNPRALALYRRLGFSEFRRVLTDVGQGIEAVIYLRLHCNPA